MLETVLELFVIRRLSVQVRLPAPVLITMAPQQQFMRRVLVVEDDYELAELLSDVLTYENCTCDIATNGMEAMEKLRGQNFDAIICDLILPRTDVESFYKEVVRLYPYLADKILFVGPSAAQRAGVGDFVPSTGNTLLEKPFEMDDFRTALLDLWKR